MHFTIFAKILVTWWCVSYPSKTWSAVIDPTDDESFDKSFQTDKYSEQNEGVNNDSFSNFLFHEGTQKYYPYNPHAPAIVGPCGRFMLLYKESNHSYNGVCLCDEFTTTCPGRPLLYWNETKRCHYAYEQGPCGEGEWLINNEKGEAHCKPNPCPLSEPSLDKYFSYHLYSFYFTHNDGVCHRTNTTAFCKGNEKVFLLGTEPGPVCLTHQPGCSGAMSVSYSAPRKCPPNTKPEEDGTCAKIVTFDGTPPRKP